MCTKNRSCEHTVWWHIPARQEKNDPKWNLPCQNLHLRIPRLQNCETVRNKFLLFRTLSLWCFVVVVSRPRHGIFFFFFTLLFFFHLKKFFYVYFLAAYIEHFFMWNMIFAILCLKIVEWNLSFIINSSDGYIWLTSQTQSPFIDLCSNSERIQINSIFHASPQKGKSKLWFFYNCKCHIIKYFSERRECPFFFCSKLAFFMTWRISHRLGSSGFPFSNSVSHWLST